MSGYRLPNRARGATLHFSFDGRPLLGHRGLKSIAHSGIRDSIGVGPWKDRLLSTIGQAIVIWPNRNHSVAVDAAITCVVKD